MKTKVALKLAIAFAGGLMFWALIFMVFMVYAFMPITKSLNQLIFMGAFPLMYIVVLNFLIVRIFKENGWKNWLVNTGLIIGAGIVSLGALDWFSKIYEIFFG